MNPPQPSRGISVRDNLLVWVGICAFALLAISHVRLLRRVNALADQSQGTTATADSDSNIPSTVAATTHEQPQIQTRRSESLASSAQTISNQTMPAVQNRLMALESRVEQLIHEPPKAPKFPAVAEYNVANPPIAPPVEPTEAEQLTPTRRGWGHEQAVGAPDTAQASDAVTAWASREPDGGPEWLALEFDHSVDVAEVRIRESYNPGAITKVTGVVNGQEVVLWQGEASTGQAPRDFVVPVTQNVQSSSIVVHLDTGRVPGWNEIDAVELIGRDGTRQWATGSSASSTYAEQ